MLHYESFGSPYNPLIVYLHGFLGSWKDGLPLAQALSAEGFFCVSIDLPGHGNSPYTDNILPSISAAIGDFQKTPLLIGYSAGGRIAMQLPLVKKGVIALSSHTGLIHDLEKLDRHKADNEWIDKLKSLPPLPFLTQWYEQPLFASLQQNPTLLSKLLADRQATYTNGDDLARFLANTSLAKQSPQALYPFPSFFLCGEYDLKYQHLYRSLPHKVIPRAGHNILLENPKDCIKIILQKIKSGIFT